MTHLSNNVPFISGNHAVLFTTVIFTDLNILIMKAMTRIKNGRGK